MKRLILFVFLLYPFAILLATNISYTADNVSIFPNPERGFIDQLEKVVTASSPNVVKGHASYFTATGDRESQRLVLVLYYLNNFKSTATLPAAVLNGFDEDMAVLRQYGYKCILRYAYTSDNTDDIAYDAPLSIVQSHINQLKSHWQDNADVIYVVQAGFIGAWGEWYYTSNFGNQQSTMNADRSALLTSLLSAVPSDRCIQLRTPLFKTGYIGDTSPLTSSEGFSGSARARLAHHNDAFLSNNGDLGTYTDTATQKAYIAQETLYVPLGGESCILSTSEAATNATYAKTTGEMSRLHWTFCKASYSEIVTNKWRSEGTFDELNRRMGYRYQLVEGSFPDNVTAGENVAITLKIRNTGYAPLYNERPVYLILKNSSNTYKVRLQTDPRRWLPNNALTEISETVKIPLETVEGTYNLYLYMPDAYSSIADNPRYSIRFANADVWDETTGMNDLNASISISSNTACCDPLEPVLLPATLKKDNVSAVSEDMTWYQNDYFDFGPDDNPNTDRWAQWAIELRYPGEYTITDDYSCPNGHAWGLQLIDADNTTIASYTTESCWTVGTETITYSSPWDLNIAQGVYTLRVQNVMEWGQPKLHSLTLSYNGELPTVEDVLETTNTQSQSYRYYDILGRQVSADHKGIVITVNPHSRTIGKGYNR